MPFRRDLERGSGTWVEAGIVSADQRARILDLDYAERGIGGRLVPIFSLLGAALLFLGMALIVSQNWDEIPRLTKIAVGEALLVGFLSLGYWVRFGRPRLHRTGEALMLVGTGIFLGNLALISQQYNIDFNPSPLLLPVVVSAVAFSYLLRSRPYAFVASGLFINWLIFESQRDGSAIETNSAAAMLLVLGAGAWLLIAAEGNRRSRYRELAAPLEFAGAVVIFATIYWLGFYRHYEVEAAVDALPTIALLAIPLALLSAALFVTAARREMRLGWPAVPERLRRPLLAIELTVLLLLVWALAVGVNPRPSAEETFMIYTTGFWALGLLLTVDLAWLGLVLRRELWVNAALFFVGLFALTRYFDFFSDYAATGTVFTGAGVLLLLLATLLERSRRLLSATMRAPTDAETGGG
jgi:uncharacterized membrane protein